MIRFLRVVGGLLFAATLSACGGGGGSAGAVPNAPTGGAQTVADFALFTDKTTMTNSGADKTRVTVVAVDANRNIVSGAAVQVSTDQNSVFTPGSDSTDSTGTYSGLLSIGSDKSDRDITVKVTVNGITKQTSVHVAGTRISLQVAPSAPSPGQASTLTVSVADSSGAPVANSVVTLGGTLPSVAGSVVTTDSTGQATKAFTAPTSSGVYTITASANGTNSTSYQLTVFETTVPSANIPSGTAPSLSASPNVLAVNSVGTSTSKAQLKFLFVDSSNRPVQNVRVRFDDQTIGLPAVGASITSGSDTLYTDASGVASAYYVAGQNSSPTGGVKVRACYKATNFTSTTDCPASVSVAITVAGQALAVSIGDDNKLTKGAGGVTYIKKFAVTVADSAGRPVPNAQVALAVDLTHYAKGNASYGWRDASGASVGGWGLTQVPADLGAAYPSLTTVPGATPEQRVWCPNEDVNRNGLVDAGTAKDGTENTDLSKDSNNQPTLEPRRSDLLVSFDDPNVTTTDASGVLLIKVEYAQRFGTWLAYKLRATANVSGSQGMAERIFVTDVLEDDVKNGAFLTPPYGVNNCETSN